MNIREVANPNISARFWKVLTSIIVGVLAILFVLLITLMIFGGWTSWWIWIVTGILAAFMLSTRYYSNNRKFPTLTFFCVLICVILVLPSFVILSAIGYHSIAQNVATQKEVDYFKSVLGRKYDYEELIVWMWDKIEWLDDSEPNLQRNTDPIQIYEYGKGKCMEFAILYSALCISQGYRTRIIDAPINDHAWTEINLEGEWTRVDSSLGRNDTRAIGYPMFFEKEPNWTAPIIALGFEGSVIVDVTATYRIDRLQILPLAVFTSIVALLIGVAWKRQKERNISVSKNEALSQTGKETAIDDIEEAKRDRLIYEIVVRRYDQEMQRATDLDTKANNVIGIAGLLVTIVGGIISLSSNIGNPTLLLMPEILLVMSAGLGLLAHWIKNYSAIQPIAVIEEYKERSKIQLLREYTYQTAQNTMDNHLVNTEKAWFINVASILLILAISLFIVSTIFGLSV